MRSKLVTLLSIVSIGLTAHAEGAKEKFERILSERAKVSIEESRKAAVLFGIKSIGVDNSNMTVQLLDYGLNFASSGKIACIFEEKLVAWTHPNEVNEAYKEATRCVTLPSSVGTPKDDYYHGAELEDQRKFDSEVRAAIKQEGFDDREFNIPSDFASRLSTYPSLGGVSKLGKDGLYLESAHSICKLEKKVKGFSAFCIKK